MDDDRLELGPDGLTDGVIRIRHLVEGDAQSYAAGMFDPAMARFGQLTAAEYTTETVRAEIRGSIADGLSKERSAVLAVVDAADDRFLGSVILSDVDWVADSAEVGFWLTPAARGRGVATRAVELLCEWCFTELGLTTVTACPAGDPPSIAVLERAGFTRGPGARWLRRASTKYRSQR